MYFLSIISINNTTRNQDYSQSACVIAMCLKTEITVKLFKKSNMFIGVLLYFRNYPTLRKLQFFQSTC